MKKAVLKLIGSGKWQMLRISLFAIIISLIVGSFVFLIVGRNPFLAYLNLLQGSGFLPKVTYAGKQNMLTDFLSFLDALTPMIFASLSVAVALKCGLFNIGVSGMMLAAGFAASATVGMSDIAAPVAKPLIILIGVMVGALAGGLMGWLKFRFNINEVVTSIMLNYILMYVITFLINMYFINPVSRQSENINESARLTLVGVRAMGLKFDLPLAFPLALITAFFTGFLLDRTTTGYEIKAVGMSRKAAEYAGINVGRNIIRTMMISGALAGMAGVTYFCGYTGSIQPGVIPKMGFDAIAVSLLGNAHPIGCILSSILITILSKGSIYLSSQQGVDIEIADLITAVILIFAACGEFFRRYVSRIEAESKRRKSS